MYFLSQFILASLLIFHVLFSDSSRAIELLQDDQAKTYYMSKDIPPQILKKMEDVSKVQLDFASSTDDFNRTDAIEDDLPMRRIIFIKASKKKSKWIIYYEHGGRGYSLKFVYAEISKKNKITAFMNISFSGIKDFDKKNINQIIHKLRNNEFTQNKYN